MVTRAALDIFIISGKTDIDKDDLLWYNKRIANFASRCEIAAELLKGPARACSALCENLLYMVMWLGRLGYSLKRGECLFLFSALQPFFNIRRVIYKR